MIKSCLALLLISCCALTSSPLYAASDDAYKINKRDFNKQVETIALAPPEAPDWMNMPDRVKTAIEQQITKALSRKGFKVLPSSELQKIRDTMQQQVGGYQQPDGTPDPDKILAVREHSLRELLFRHPVDAVLGINIRLVAAPFENDKAEWDEITQKVQKTDDSLYDLMTGGKYSGNIGASSLRLSVWDRSENLLYSNAGGIELVMKRNGKKLLQLPAEQLFLDEKRIQSAVKIALKPF